MATIEEAPTVPSPQAGATRKARYSRGAELLTSLAAVALGALATALLMSAADTGISGRDRLQAGVLALSAILVTAAFAGIARMEANKTRKTVTANTESAVIEVRAEVRREVREMGGRILAEMRGLTEQAIREQGETPKRLDEMADALRWIGELRRDLDAIGNPSLADMEPMLYLRNIAQRLHDSDA